MSEDNDELPKRMLPLECIQCGVEEGPLWPEDADCAGWLCPKCYAEARAAMKKMMAEMSQ